MSIEELEINLVAIVPLQPLDVQHAPELQGRPEKEPCPKTRSICIQTDMEYDYEGFEFLCEHVPTDECVKTERGEVPAANAATYVSTAIMKESPAQTDVVTTADGDLAVTSYLLDVAHVASN